MRIAISRPREAVRASCKFATFEQPINNRKATTKKYHKQGGFEIADEPFVQWSNTESNVRRLRLHVVSECR